MYISKLLGAKNMLQQALWSDSRVRASANRVLFSPSNVSNFNLCSMIDFKITASYVCAKYSHLGPNSLKHTELPTE